jgi:hypothetical protein
VKAGIQGTVSQAVFDRVVHVLVLTTQKYALDHFVQKGLGGIARYPLGPLNDATKQLVEKDLAEDWEFESKL